MRQILQCLLSPRLYKIYYDGTPYYTKNKLERWGSNVIISANAMLNLGIYSSPLLLMYLYRRGLYTVDEMKTMGRVFGGIGCIIAASLLLRAVGRVYNPEYMKFMKVLNQDRRDMREYLMSIRMYDFDFSHWPVSFAVPRKAKSWSISNPFKNSANPDMGFLFRLLIQILAIFASRTFAIRLIYPGTLSVIHNLLVGPALLHGRTQLVEVHDGKRAKIATADGNHIDTMFVDKRGDTRGDMLVICCEGNSGFYEVGIMVTPIKAGFSALGWNHPGFATSTGMPFPSQEHNAIDAVVQYAKKELGFQENQLVFFGWSIGGYTATWAAVKYPACKALILDATFDDLLPLAERQMPASWRRLVREVVRSHVDLHIAELISKYSGPVKLVRRTEDEIICLEQGKLKSNRGNHLLLKLLEARHPETLEKHGPAMAAYAALRDSQRVGVDDNDGQDENGRPLLLINKYMCDYRSTHCTPLPDQEFVNILKYLLKRDL
ncbi:phosphatidylserine lipase ABHD16A [Plutella xylostella]|uniref:phosphatidylserine lipase ABHD16A n=1 Tax=Plutella xylostella TaxID=51655 RepID=UPI002032FD9B|nr:phosphatidylserine lipase ABHD16A [Plutella xylostella]